MTNTLGRGSVTSGKQTNSARGSRVSLGAQSESSQTDPGHAPVSGNQPALTYNGTAAVRVVPPGVSGTSFPADPKRLAKRARWQAQQNKTLIRRALQAKIQKEIKSGLSKETDPEQKRPPTNAEVGHRIQAPQPELKAREAWALRTGTKGRPSTDGLCGYGFFQRVRPEHLGGYVTATFETRDQARLAAKQIEGAVAVKVRITVEEVGRS